MIRAVGEQPFSRRSWLLLQSMAISVTSIVIFFQGLSILARLRLGSSRTSKLIEIGIRLYRGTRTYLEGIAELHQGVGFPLEALQTELFNTRSAQRPAWPERRSRLPGPSWRVWPDPSKCFRCMLPNSASASRSSLARCLCCRGRQQLIESFRAAGLPEYREW